MGAMHTSIQIFRRGRHQDSSGTELTFGDAELRDLATSYNPALYQAPLVVGHPRHDAPAYGWVAGLSYADTSGTLEASPDQVDPEFAELVNAGRLKYVSASLYLPDSPQNPTPGHWYLRHVGFLGAQPPAIKGLRAHQFAEGESGVVTLEFSEAERWGWRTLADLFRRLRERTLVTSGAEVADALVPEYALQALADADADAAPVETPLQYQECSMDPTAVAERERQLDAEAQRLKDWEARLAAEQQTRHRADCLRFTESLVSGGRLLPLDQAPLATLLAELPEHPSADFAEGEGQPERPPAVWLREFLGRLPVQVDFTERSAPAARSGAKVAEFSAPDGYQADAGALALHHRALQYQIDHPDTAYADAVKAVA